MCVKQPITKPLVKRTAAITLFILLFGPLLQGCNKAAMERAIALADQPEPGSLTAPAIGTEPTQRALPCKAMVFRRYCLGGSIQELLNEREPFRQREVEETTQYDFRDKYRITTVSTYDGKIMSLIRLERPASWRIFRGLLRRLERNYGIGEDQSIFPSYAEDHKSRQQAIYSNQGEALQVWERLGWSIRLRWNNTKWIETRFQDDELIRAYLASPPGPYP